MSNLAIGEAFEFMQHDHFAKFSGQSLKCAPQEIAFGFAPEKGVGFRVVLGRTMSVIDEEFRDRLALVLPQLRIANIAHDRQQPRPAVAAPETIQRAIGAYTGVLHGIFRGVFVAQQPEGEVISGIQMRQHEMFESRRHMALHLDINAGDSGFIPAKPGKVFSFDERNNHTVNWVFNGKGPWWPFFNLSWQKTQLYE